MGLISNYKYYVVGKIENDWFYDFIILPAEIDNEQDVEQLKENVRLKYQTNKEIIIINFILISCEEIKEVKVDESSKSGSLETN